MPYRDPDQTGLRDLLRQFGVELRRCRLRCGLSQVKLADLSGVSQSSISRLERGRAPYAGLHLILRLGAAMEGQLPLAFCPHRHSCGWEQLDLLGNPLRQASSDDDGWWQRLQRTFD